MTTTAEKVSDIWFAAYEAARLALPPRLLEMDNRFAFLVNAWVDSFPSGYSAPLPPQSEELIHLSELRDKEPLIAVVSELRKRFSVA